MANNFFSKFPRVQYNMDGQGSFLSLTNFTKNVDVNDFFANHSAFYTYHEIVDGERPDTVSYHLYGNTNYYWTFFILNNDLRNGLGSAWPLSSGQFDRMIEQEYDKYSAITLLPSDDLTINGVGLSGLMQLTYLDSAYLPYLRFMNASGTEQGSILKYDSSLLQLVVSDIVKSDGSGPVSSVTPFVSSPYFQLAWINPFDEDSDEYVENEVLRTQFVDKQLSVYAEFDPDATVDPETLSELESAEAISEAISQINDAYIFSKRYTPASPNYIWASYRNAASEYYTETSEDTQVSVSAFDVLSNPSIITPKYISNHDAELSINNRKEKIRVLRPDRVVEFVTSYFALLNNNSNNTRLSRR